MYTSSSSPPPLSSRLLAMSSPPLLRKRDGGYCDNVGVAYPDLAGLGVLWSFGGQALLSLAVAAWVYVHAARGRLDVRAHEGHAFGSAEYRRRTRRLRHMCDLLMVGNDIQVLLGIAYMITAWTKREKIGLYHLRLAFDTVSFVGVSSTTALACWAMCHHKLNERVSRLSFRYLSIYVYEAFFVVLTMILLVNLARWDSYTDDTYGVCYNTRGSAPVGAPHPFSDQLYVVVMACWLLGGMLLATLTGPGPKRTTLLLVFAVLQYPVHLYFMVAVRHANQPWLDGHEKEDNWDFGQTTAMLLLGLAYVEIGEKTWRYRKEGKLDDRLGAAQKMESDLRAEA